MTAAQCRAARAWLQWTQVHLARMASLNGQDINLTNVQQWEGGGRLSVEKHIAIRNALQHAGIRFISTTGIEKRESD
jgi:hypothetical protein